MKIPAALIGCQVWRTSFDYQVRLVLVGRDQDEGCRVDAELIIETPFLLRDTAGQWHELDPGTGSSLAQILDLLMTTINDVDIDQHGALSIGFDHGAELSIRPHPEFESWHLAGHGIDPILVGPGGENDWQPGSNP